MSGYILPKSIPTDMGGIDQVLDQRLEDVVNLLRCAPLDTLGTVLDIGIGGGQIAKFLAEMGKTVIGTGLEFASYETDDDMLRNDHAVRVVEAIAEKMPFKNAFFDAVVMSHVLEHCPNVGLALREVKRVLKENGYLFLFVPPSEDVVCAGHISVGWNIGQLMYVLLLNGFDVKTGQFVQYRYNVCAFVRKSSIQLPPLRGDRGDIHILANQDLFPLPIISRDGSGDHFSGKLKALNWRSDFPYGRMSAIRLIGRAIERLFYRAVSLLPYFLRRRMGKMLSKAAGIVLDEGNLLANPNLSQIIAGNAEDPKVLSD